MACMSFFIRYKETLEKFDEYAATLVVKDSHGLAKHQSYVKANICTSIRYDSGLEMFSDYAVMLGSCQGVLRWSKAKLLV